jgi:hypothetical protein
MTPPPYRSGRKHGRDEDDYDRQRNGTRRDDMSKKHKSTDGPTLPVPVPVGERDQVRDRQKIQQDIEKTKVRIVEMPRSGRPLANRTPSRSKTESKRPKIDSLKHRASHKRPYAQWTNTPDKLEVVSQSTFTQPCLTSTPLPVTAENPNSLPNSPRR